VLHSLPTAFQVDGVGVENPVSMLGDTVRARVHVICAASSPLRNLIAAVERSHLKVMTLVAQPLASGLCCLTKDEQELGCTVLDFGANSTSYALFYRNALVEIGQVSSGGVNMTQDIARGLNTPLSQAERIKNLHASAIAGQSGDRETIIVPQVGEVGDMEGARFPKSELARIVHARLEEIFGALKKKLGSSPFRKYACERWVLTGGASQVPSLGELTSFTLGKKARLGRPVSTQGVDEVNRQPGLGCVIGLLRYAQAQGEKGQSLATKSKGITASWAWVRKTSHWIKENL
ncbi:MAG: cell division protein FtsA, partial [bacterium]|nr:cell division protein FtsA [bacterium]